MHCIALVQATPTDPEIAILQMDSKEHRAFHENALAFVNGNEVFKKHVASVEIAPHSKVQTGVALVVHLPGCACVAYCGQV
jgi:hypothetical protein